MWALIIIVLISGGYSQNMATVTNVPGFQSEELCRAAAEKVSKQFRTSSTICVKIAEKE